MLPVEDLLRPDVQSFIREHESEDEGKLLLKHKSILNIPASLIAQQISGRRKSKFKLPFWHETRNILYPPSLNLEQCSSETTAQYKVGIIKSFVSTNPARVVDLTGGFGVDSFFLSSICKETLYVEPDEMLFEIVKQNHSVLHEKRRIKNAGNIHHHHSTAESFLNSAKETFDLIYIDPSRRTKGNQKIFRFADCVPNVIQLLPRIFELTEHLLIKASPLIDLQSGIKELACVEKVFVVAVDNECKEVLFLCRKNFNGEATIRAVNLNSADDSLMVENSFDFQLAEERNSNAAFSNPLSYLYEPNAAILKSGAFKLIGNRFQLSKLQQHTHLYTSGHVVQDFPGRVFKIEALVKPDAKNIRAYFEDGKANVVTRNYPLSAEQLKKKVGLKDGGEKFLIGFSGQTEKFTAVCSRIQ